MAQFLAWGIANPAGEEDSYNGLHLKANEIDSIVEAKKLVGLPVKIEHKGVSIGKVVSAFKDHQNQLNCVFEVDTSELEGAIAQRWIEDNVAKDLSLGYVVNIDQTNPDRLQAGAKKILEVSIVKKGAREGCHIKSHLPDDIFKVFSDA